jgi:DNA polymerase I-like protein with 3'-5' exonuclease and polymerase domains
MTTKNFIRVDDPAKLAEHVRRMIQEDLPISIDIESGYVGPDRAGIALLPFHPDWRMVSIQFTNSLDWAVFVPIGFDDGNNIETIAAARLMWRMVNTGRCIAHNASFELNTLARWFRDVLWDDTKVGAEVRASLGYWTAFSDTMIEAYMMAAYQRIGLKDLTHNVLHKPQAEIDTLFPELVKKKKTRFLRFNTLTQSPEAIAYACEDVIFALELHQLHYPQVKDNLMFRTEILLTPVLCRMEFEGMELDWAEYERREKQTAIFKEKLNEEIQKEFSERLGRMVDVNFASPQQVAKLVYEDLGYAIKERTETGAASTAEGAMRAIAAQDANVSRILQWREVGALLSRYLTKYLKEFRYAEDGRAHPNHKQTGAGTGRLSVDGVSYQQWPKPYHYELKDGTTYDLNYRDFLISPEDYRIIGYDFSQVELRILAGMANETGLLKAFADGTDIHKATASMMMGIPLDQVTKKDRAKGKTLNFAVVYGSGAGNIGDLLGISTEEAQALLDQYFATFNKLKAWMDARVVEGRQQGYVETMFGRKFKVWEYLDSRDWMKSKGDRMCVNAPVQGGAADYMKLGMVRAASAIRKAEESGLIPVGGIRLIMTVHDALEFYVHKSVATQTVIDIIQPAVSFPVKGLPEILAEWHEGYKWGSVAEILLTPEKKIKGYEMTVETPAKETLHWEGSDLMVDVLNPYNDWAMEFYRFDTEAPEKKPFSTSVVEKYPVLVLNEKQSETQPGPSPDQKPGDPVPESPWEEEPGKEAPAADPTNSSKEEFDPGWFADPEFTAKAVQQKVTVTLDDMPDEVQFDRLQTFLSDRPGTTSTLTLATPEGEIEWPTKLSLTAQDGESISAILGGARVHKDSEIDLDL